MQRRDIHTPSELQAQLFSIPWGTEAKYFCAAMTQVLQIHTDDIYWHPCQDEGFLGSSSAIL